MNKIKVAVIASLLLLVIGIHGWTMSFTLPAAEAQETEWNMEGFIDLIGTVNFTYDPTGENYTPFLSMNSVHKESISFAMSIGPRHVFYCLNGITGDPIGSIEEMYTPYAEVVLLWEMQDNSSKSESSFGFGAAGAYGAEYTPTNENLTVDTLDETTVDEPDIKPIDMLGGNASALVSTSLVTRTIDSAYSKDYKRLIDFDDEDVLYDEADDAKELGALGTDNMTEVIYSWLARYIEQVKGYEPYTVMIDANTETVTSEALTVAMDETTATAIREIIDETLQEEGAAFIFPAVLDAVGGLGSIGTTLSSRISKKGTFSFAKGIGLSALKGGARLVRSTAKAADSLGGMATKAVISAAVSTPSLASKFGAFTYRASAKTTKFFTDAAGKIAKTKFSFLAGPIKFVGKTVSFFIRYWWLFIGLFGVGFIMFATPVGPFIMNSTIRKWSK